MLNIFNIFRAGKIDEAKVFKLPADSFIGGKESALPLKDILKRLESVYCHHIGAEFMYLDSLEERDWIRKRLETPGTMDITADKQKIILKWLVMATQ